MSPYYSNLMCNYSMTRFEASTAMTAMTAFTAMTAMTAFTVITDNFYYSGGMIWNTIPFDVIRQVTYKL